MRSIDADALFKSFESEENPEDSLWTLYGIKRKIEDAPTQEPCEDATLRDIFCMGCEYKEQELNTGHWIPVSERLPKPNVYVSNVRKYYLIQNEYGDMQVAYYSDIGWVPIYSIKAAGYEVVAWMPLPKPYEPQESEE